MESQTQMRQDIEMSQDTEMSQEDQDMRGFIFPNKSHAMKHVTFTTDNAADISLALNDKYNRIGCVSHHINLIIKCAFKNVRSAANLLAQCKNIVMALNHSLPLVYEVRELQKELGFPDAVILQEMVTRWWSILAMLESIIKSETAIMLALHRNQRYGLILEPYQIK